MNNNIGKVKQILGAVVDVRFDSKLPEILNALTIKHEKKKSCSRSCPTFRRKYR